MNDKVLCAAMSSRSGPHLALLRDAGFDCVIPDAGLEFRGRDAEPLVRALQGVAAVIAGGELYSEETLRRCSGLRVIARDGVGYNGIDLAACDALGIAVTITPGVNHHTVAEHTMAMLLAAARGFPGRDQQVRRGEWRRTSTPRTMGRTLGLVGFGRIGRAVASRAIAFGLHVIACDPFVSSEEADQADVRLVSFEELLGESDFISLHAPGTPDTDHLINDQTIEQMKPGAILINTARGQLVDEVALIHGLSSGHLAAAALDVFESEPLPPDNPLTTLDNVLLSPHVAGLDHESFEDTYRMIADTLIRLRAGDRPEDRLVNLQQSGDWIWKT